jgi:oxidase EvaA
MTRTVTSLGELQAFLAATIAAANFQLQAITLAEQTDWALRDGALSHRRGGFFHVNGLIDRRGGAEQLVLFQPQSALTGLALHRRDSTVYVLLQARIEPGNSGIGQYGPTIQSTPANYQRVHGGKTTAYLDLFTQSEGVARPLATSTQLDLGKRYYQKNKSHVYVEVDTLLPTEPHMVWVPLAVLQAACALDNFLNADLRSLLSVFDWDLYLGAPAAPPWRTGAAFCQALLAGNRQGERRWELTALTALQHWQPAASGVISRTGAGLSVAMYLTSCTTREVSVWAQPLMQASGSGRVLLALRDGPDGAEVLLSLRAECGISGGQTLLPSQVFYPGDSAPVVDGAADAAVMGVVMAEFVQSDEGGRFYRCESRYQLLRAAPDLVPAAGQYWVPVSTLRQLLKTSNLLSFQLRCVASLLLDQLNPAALAG